MKTYVKYTNKNKSTFQFVESTDLPKNLPISTPMNFVFVGSELLMCIDKDGKWNVVCGKIEQGETWQESLIRETHEEVGAGVKELFLIGYIICENHVNSNFQAKTYFPVCYSFASTINYDWYPKETQKRDWFSGEHSVENLRDRDDNEQLFEIYQYIKEILKNNIVFKFEFIPDKILDNIPATSTATFCFNNQKECCVVRDRGEDFLSLPAGSRSINEKIEDGAWRELWEEAKIKKEDLKNWQLLGSILVSLYSNNKIVSQMQQVRFVCSIDTIEYFDFSNNDWETDFRDFIPFDKLGEFVRSLRNDTGKDILSYLKTKIM